MLIFQDFEELFYEENFKLFNDELKHQLDESMKIDMKQKLENIQNTKFIISLSYQSLINIEDFKKQIEIERLNQQREFNALKHKVNIKKLSIENKKLNRELQSMMSNVNLEIKKTDILSKKLEI